MIASRMDNPYRTQQIDALAKRLVQKGLRPMLLCIDEGNTTEQLLSILLNYRVSGVVITSDAPPVKICDECARMGVPLVLVDRGDDLPFVDRVNGDDIKGGTLAAEAMINAGRRRFAVVQQHSLGYSGLVRISAFEARIAKQGFETQKIFVDADEYAGGAAAAVQVARLLGTDTGVFCPSDTIALGLIDGLQTRHNAQIPKDLSLIGYDDIPQARWVFADLTTIRQSVEQFAAATVQLLQDRIAAPDASPQSTVIDVELISRSERDCHTI